jgi:hypothetical protein
MVVVEAGSGTFVLTVLNCICSHYIHLILLRNGCNYVPKMHPSQKTVEGAGRLYPCSRALNCGEDCALLPLDPRGLDDARRGFRIALREPRKFRRGHDHHFFNSMTST